MKKFSIVLFVASLITCVASFIYLPYNAEYSISYNLNGGSVSTKNTEKYTSNDYVNISNPTRYGYTFLGWTGSNGSNPQTNIHISNGSTGNKIYTANWQIDNYSITYDLAGGSLQYSNPSSYNINSSFTLNNPTKSGYYFLGWTGSNGSSPQTNVKISSGNTGNKNYIANWEQLVNYSITYYLNGGSVSGNPTSYDKYSNTITLNNPTKSNYEFIGWTGSNGSTPQKNVTIPTGSTGNKTYTANFTAITYSISYNLNGGSGSNRTSYTIDDSFTLNNPTKTGYDFIGWTGSNGSTPQKNVKISAGSTGNKSYTANWKAITYSISYNLNGGSASNRTSYTVDDSFTLNNPTKNGYDFTGWTGSNGSTPQKTVKIFSGSTGNKSYTANWTVKNYTITYDLAGGSLSNSNPTSYNINSSFTLNNPTKDDCDFVGWTGSNGSTPQMTVKISSGSTGDKNYIANWGINYTITYNLNGGSVSENPTIYSEYNTITLNNPTRTGYEFLGWTGSNGSTPQKNVTIPTGSTGNKTYTANWEIITYSINYNLNGGTISGNNKESYTIKDSFTLINPTKSDYIFIGWTGSNGSTPQKDITISGSFGNKSYTANWKKEVNLIIPNGTTSINSNQYSGRLDIISVSIPNTVKSIGSNAFKGCSNLKSIAIPNSVTSIGEGAFNGCSSLESITLPFVGGSATASNSSRSVLFGYIFGTESYTGGVETSQGYHPSEYYYWEHYYIPSSLKEVTITSGNILYGAFMDCSHIEKITLLKNLKSIGRLAFCGCISLTSVTFEENSQLKSIDSLAFESCISLTSIVIPSSVTSISEMAFYNCYRLVEIYNLSTLNIYAKVIHTSLDEPSNLIISNEVIYFVDETTKSAIGPVDLSAKNISLDNDCTEVNKYAFYECNSLTSITIPSSVTSIGSNAFRSCFRLVEIYNLSTLNIIKGSNENGFVGYYAKVIHKSLNELSNLVTSNGVIYYVNKTKSLIGPVDLNATSVTIDNNCIEINKYAFYECANLKSITIPNSVITIGEWAFYKCENLTSIIIPSSVISIDNYVFYYCSSLTSIVIPNSVTSIGEKAFSGCSILTSVTFQNTNGWKVSSNSNMSSSTTLSSSNLSNTSTAATYLTSTYYNYFWKRY